MKIAVLSPLPPARSGVAHYTSMLLPELASRMEVRAFETLDQYRRQDFDAVVYQLGNNPHHEVMYRAAMREPGVVVLHDLVLHHLIVEITLACGDVEGYVAALEASHGPAGAAWARGRAAGLHSEMGNFLLPASVEVAQRSLAVIVHNQYAAARLRSFGVTTPIHVVPHPYFPETRRFDRAALRARHGFDASQRVIGFFGFLTSAKRAEVVLEAFEVARQREPGLALLVVGEPAPNIDVAAMQSDGVVFTGYVSDDEFPAYYAAADRFVNLRYPSAGETSGTLMRALDAGKPVAVSDYAQFAELPDDIVFKIPLGRGEHGAGEVERLAEFFTAGLDDPSARQRAWLEENATLAKCGDGYVQVLEHALESSIERSIDQSLDLSLAKAGSRSEGPGAIEDVFSTRAERTQRESSLPLFPQLELLDCQFESEWITLRVRNTGASTLRARTYGQPEYRLIAKLLDAGGKVVQDRWLALPGDLRPGETAALEFRRVGEGAVQLRLEHALQDIPMLPSEGWESVDVR